MPLSKVERQVLEVIYEEHRQTRRGAKAMIVHVGMNAKTSEQKARIVDVLHALLKRGLLVAGADSWVPTKEGVNYIEQPGWIGVDMAAPEGDALAMIEHRPLPSAWLTKEQIAKHLGVSTDQLGGLEDRVFSHEELAAAKSKAIDKWAEDKARLFMGLDRISDDLLNRCAAMNATLLAQAEKDHAAGDPDAWRDLHWLMETGKQLVAMRGAS